MLKKAKNKSIGRILLAVAAIALLMASNMVTFASATETGNVGVNQTITADSMEAMSKNTVNYTEMALDFVREHYPNRTLRILNIYENYTPYPETGYVYARIGIEITPGEGSPHDSVDTSIRHDTLHIEFGYSQCWNDYQEFLASLPRYYRYMSSESRTAIMQKFGYYPDISDPVAETYLTNFTIRFHPENQAKVESYLKELGLDYSIQSPPYYETYIVSHMSLKECLLIGNQSYVKSASIGGQVPIEDDDGGALGIYVVLAIIAVTAIVGALAFICIRKHNHLKSEMKEEVGEEHVEKGKE